MWYLFSKAQPERKFSFPRPFWVDSKFTGKLSASWPYFSSSAWSPVGLLSGTRFVNKIYAQNNTLVELKRSAASGR